MLKDSSSVTQITITTLMLGTYAEKILQEDAMDLRVNSGYSHPMLKIETSFPLQLCLPDR